MKYQKKPVVIDAIQWDGTYDGMKEIERKFPDLRLASLYCHPEQKVVYHWKISTLEGSYAVSPMDYIIRGVNGEFYPCKPDIFEMTYQLPDSPSWKSVREDLIKSVMRWIITNINTERVSVEDVPVLYNAYCDCHPLPSPPEVKE